MSPFIIGVIVLGITVATVAIAIAPPHARLPLAIFNFFYILTSAIGATLIVDPTVRVAWMLMLPSMDASWLSPGSSALYWIAVWGPLLVTNGTALLMVGRLRSPALHAARLLEIRPDLLTCALVGASLIGYCVFNLAAHGFIGAGLLSGASVGDYRQNIIMRTNMAEALGDTHYGLIFMAIPAVCLVALERAVRTRSAQWWGLLLVLSLALIALYATTLTKSNLVVFGLAIVVGAVTCGLLRVWGTLIATAMGVVVLTVQEFLLSGGSPLEILRTLSNILFRMASGVPFYLEAFPAQFPFVGIDFGLSWLGIGPTNSSNLMISNLMFPGDTWVQGAVPAPAHVAGYAEGGLGWSICTMVLVGLLIAFAGAFRRASHSPLTFSAYVGAVVAIYYTTQTDFVGVFAHSYGYKWWLFGLAALAISQKSLEFVVLAARDPRVSGMTVSSSGVAPT
jgi:hypothetical protein